MSLPPLRSFSALCGLLLLLALGAAPLAAQVASVTDVRASQRAGTHLVDIHYNLSGPAEGVTISVTLSDDGGATYILPAISLTGAVGHGVLPGANRHIVWDAGTDLPNYFGSNMRFRVSAAVRPTGMELVQGATVILSMGERTVDTFWIARHEVTWGEWRDVRERSFALGYDLGGIGAGCADDHPVHSVSWFDVLKWCNAKSRLEGLEPVYRINGDVYKTGTPAHTSITQDLSANGYRLPLEAEWEFAARGGNRSLGFTYAGSNDLNEVGWFTGNSGNAACNLSSGRGTWPVGQKAPNELGLYDMSGNVWEWCWDASGSYRRIRGGSWDFSAVFCAVSGRYVLTPSVRNFSYGFRLARSSGQ